MWDTSSRVQLSMGMPTVDVANTNYVTRCKLDEEERRAWEVRPAELDVDLTEKHGLVVEGNASDNGEGGDGSKGGSGYAFPDAPLCISRLNYLLKMHVNLIL